MEFTFRRRLDTATVTVPCGGEQHEVHLNLGVGVSHTVHDQDADDVYLFLGGEPHPCQRVSFAYWAANARDRAYRGIEDPTWLQAHPRWNGGWRTEATCRACAPRTSVAVPRTHGQGNLAHFLSFDHLADHYSTDANLIRKAARWMTDRIADDGRLTPAVVETVRTRCARLGQDRYGLSTRNVTDNVLTPAYVDAVARIYSATRPAGFSEFVLWHRANVALPITWVRELAEHVDPQRVARAVDKAGGRRDFAHILWRSRSVPAPQVAAYLNAGIYSHFRTYASHHASPEQVLAVYRASDGQLNLAQFLHDGTSIPDAIARAAAPAAAS